YPGTASRRLPTSACIPGRRAAVCLRRPVSRDDGPTPLLPQPVSRLQELLVELRLGRAGLGGPVVAPADLGGERHEDRLGAAAGLDAEEGAAVDEEVELDVAAAAVELEVALALAVGEFLAAADDR